MNEMIDNITYLKESITDIIKVLRIGKVNQGSEMFLKQFSRINSIYAELIEKAEYYKEKEIEIPTEVLVMQLQNLLDAYENKDIIMLADTLEYEVNNAILFYEEIRKI